MPRTTNMTALFPSFSLRKASVLLFLGLVVSACEQKEMTSDEVAAEVTIEMSDEEIRAQLQGSAGATEEHPGADLYTTRCATCHDSGVARAPARNLMELLSPQALLTTLESGIMQQQAAMLTTQERHQIVEYLVGSAEIEFPELAYCEADQNEFDWEQGPAAEGWGIDRNNRRHLSAEQADLSASDLDDLEIKWVFDYPLSARARSHPSLAGGALHVGSQTGTLYALEQTTGCVRWTYEAGAEVRTGITIPDWNNAEAQHPIGYFGDVLANGHAVNLVTGEGLWKSKVDDHPNATLTGQPVFFEDKLYQPLSSLEVVPAADPGYACCTFRGSITVLDSATGEVIGKTYTIPQTPTQVATNNVGTPIIAPSGAPVWNSPTLDEKNRRLYFGTGENYSSPADENSDAIIAMNIDDGSIEWVQQTIARDAWNVACMVFIQNKTNCPIEKGPDLDFGAPPMLIEQGDERILVAGQKSGEIFGISVDDGQIVWRNKIGRGGNQGGMHFGMAADGSTVYVPMADYTDESLSEADARPGMYALDAFSGEILWSHPADNVCGDKIDCDPGVSAAVTSIEGAVLAGHMDGRFRAYAKQDGQVLWEVDTDREFTALSGRTAHGGSFGGGTAAMAYRGMLYVNSGYGLYFHRPGNVLIAWGKR